MAHAVETAASACRRRKVVLRETRRVHDHTPVKRSDLDMGWALANRKGAALRYELASVT